MKTLKFGGKRLVEGQHTFFIEWKDVEGDLPGKRPVMHHPKFGEEVDPSIVNDPEPEYFIKHQMAEFVGPPPAAKRTAAKDQE